MALSRKLPSWDTHGFERLYDDVQPLLGDGDVQGTASQIVRMGHWG